MTDFYSNFLDGILLCGLIYPAWLLWAGSARFFRGKGRGK